MEVTVLPPENNCVFERHFLSSLTIFIFLSGDEAK